MFAGIDEAGRGPLAGPVVAAAVILQDPTQFLGLTDSKRLSPKKREQLALQIKEQAQWGIGMASPQEIDEINILQASLLAMKRAYEQLPVQPNWVKIDGLHGPKLTCRIECIVKGDLTVPAISAASILAKVTRDAIMLAYDSEYPEYGFGQHKGYPTAIHVKALQVYGVTPIHRQSFAPVKQCLRVVYEA